MDNELDRRLGRLEAGQAKQSEQLGQLIAEQQHTLRTLQQLVVLMQEPDEDGEKLHNVLARMAAALVTNTASVDNLHRAILQRSPN